MAAKQHVLEVVKSDGTHGADAHVASDENAADGIAGLQRCLPAWSWLGAGHGAGAAAAGYRHPHLLKLRGESGQNVFRKTREIERGLDGNHAGDWERAGTDRRTGG